MILDTMTRRGLVDSLYNERHSQCLKAAEILGKPILREVSLIELQAQSSKLSPLLYRRAGHVLSESARQACCRSNAQQRSQITWSTDAAVTC